MGNTIQFDIVVNGTQALQTFHDVEQAGQGVVNKINEIKHSSDMAVPGAAEYFDSASSNILSTIDRIGRIDKETSDVNINDYKREQLFQERDILIKSIESWFSDLDSTHPSTVTSPQSRISRPGLRLSGLDPLRSGSTVNTTD